MYGWRVKGWAYISSASKAPLFAGLFNGILFANINKDYEW